MKEIGFKHDKCNLLITGASGFVGRPLSAELLARGYMVRAAVRNAGTSAENSAVSVVGEIDGETRWAEALSGIDAVIHLAARVHVMHDNSDDPLAEFRRTNTTGTEHLARSAAANGVRRLVYVSSIKVNGEETSDGRIYSENDIPAPQDPYGISKWEAEQVLQRVAQETGLEIVIVRPPLVYGAGVKGNFAQMMRVVASGLPLPLASVRNKRDLVYVGNLVDALVVCATHPTAAGNTYLVSDGEDISTPDLLHRLGEAMGHAARVFSCPLPLLKLAGRLTGKSSQIERLLGSLQVDSGKIRRELNWIPPYSLQQGLQATAEWYRNTHL
ncbi:SDR family oxidoreductase [Sideroxydans sp. CL21]|uniref:UDP-glucose 4-epimerase family protein n=1 Tax=Sideroxydans sp. CL21 TaxID=2600596 RepID=UPI0024BD448A|nr:SDR family oxidoreductase [Sideroxydans sp. CL21]